MKEPVYIDAQNFGIQDQFYIEELTLSHAFPLHRHSFAEFEYVIDGNGIDRINGVDYSLKKGSISLKLLWHAHELVPDANSVLHLYKCSFRLNPTEEERTFGNLSSLVVQCFKYAPVTDIRPEFQSNVETLFKEMLSERKNANPWKDELLSAKISELLIFFLRSVKEYTDLKKDKLADNEAFNVWEVVKQINERYDEPDLSLASISARFFYSESHLSKLLKAQVGLSFSELVQDTRVRNACNLLKYTTYSVEDIAKKVGFSSRNSLFDAFETVKGISPTNYRKENAQNDLSGINRTSFSSIYTNIVYYLHSHYMEDLSLESVAKAFHYNETYFSSMISGNGTAFTDLLAEIRIYYACKLLLISEYTNEEIGQKVGFKSPETFYRTFKKLRGCTPAKYQKDNQPRLREISDNKNSMKRDSLTE